MSLDVSRSTDSLERQAVWAGRLVQPIGPKSVYRPPLRTQGELAQIALCYDRIYCLERLDIGGVGPSLPPRSQFAAVVGRPWHQLVWGLYDAGILIPSWPDPEERGEAFETAVRMTLDWASKNEGELAKRREEVTPFREEAIAYIAFDKMNDPTDFVRELRRRGADASIVESGPPRFPSGSKAVRADVQICRKLMHGVSGFIASNTGADIIFPEAEFGTFQLDEISTSPHGARDVVAPAIFASLRVAPVEDTSVEALIRARIDTRVHLDKFADRIDAEATELARRLADNDGAEMSMSDLSEYVAEVRNSLLTESGEVSERLRSTGVKASLVITCQSTLTGIADAALAGANPVSVAAGAAAVGSLAWAILGDQIPMWFQHRKSAQSELAFVTRLRESLAT